MEVLFSHKKGTKAKRVSKLEERSGEIEPGKYAVFERPRLDDWSIKTASYLNSIG